MAFNKNGDEKMLYFPGEAGEILREMVRSRGMSSYVFDLTGPLRRCENSHSLRLPGRLRGLFR